MLVRNFTKKLTLAASLSLTLLGVAVNFSLYPVLFVLHQDDVGLHFFFFFLMGWDV